MRSYPSSLDPDVAVVLPEGRLDAQASPDLEDALASLESRGSKRLVLNLSQATYLSSSGLRVILIHVRRLRQSGGDLKLCCVLGKVARVMQIAGFDAVLGIFANENLAVQAFQKPQESDAA